jgi:hypothetical protein
MCLELQVEDARAAHGEAVKAGLPITLPLTQEPFGQKRFGFHDPAGLWVDIVEQTESAEGFWEQMRWLRPPSASGGVGPGRGGFRGRRGSRP